MKALIPVSIRKVEVKVKDKEKRSHLRWEFLNEESFLSCFLLLNLNLSLNLAFLSFYRPSGGPKGLIGSPCHGAPGRRRQMEKSIYSRKCLRTRIIIVNSDIINIIFVTICFQLLSMGISGSSLS